MNSLQNSPALCGGTMDVRQAWTGSADKHRRQAGSILMCMKQRGMINERSMRMALQPFLPPPHCRCRCHIAGVGAGEQ
eukprot:768249-Hanusia_phi.AAC.2